MSVMTCLLTSSSNSPQAALRARVSQEAQDIQAASTLLCPAEGPMNACQAVATSGLWETCQWWCPRAQPPFTSTNLLHDDQQWLQGVTLVALVRGDQRSTCNGVSSNCMQAVHVHRHSSLWSLPTWKTALSGLHTTSVLAAHQHQHATIPRKTHLPG